MKIFTEITPLKAYLRDMKCQGKSVGLVPTMGALHEGHLALFRKSIAANDVTVGSIFVNPIQFNNPGDLQHYPRTLDKDTQLLESVGCDVLFAPDVPEMYPENTSITFDFGALERTMEGRFRPGHFSGVAVVVSKLFNIVEPDNAYFGQKDWQQFAIIRKLTQQLNFSIQLHSVETLRAPDGLALSSRNARLNEEQREYATVFYRALTAARTWLKNGETMASIRTKVQQMIDQEPDVRLEYFELADSQNLNELQDVKQSDRPILCIAGYVGEVRLIDNLFID
jgi:pantoate--beta-alanine ligase